MRTQTITVDGRPWTVNVPDIYVPLFNTINTTINVPSAAGVQTIRLVLTASGSSLGETRTTNAGRTVFSIARLAQALYYGSSFISDEDQGERFIVGKEQNYTLTLTRKISADQWETLTSVTFYAFYGSLLPKEQIPYCKLYRNFPSYLNLGYMPNDEQQPEFYINGMALGDVADDFGMMYLSRTATGDLLPDLDAKTFTVTNQHNDVTTEGEVDCVADDNKHLCLRFLNRFGCPQTVVLTRNETASQADTATAFTRRAADYDERQRNAYGIYEQQTHAERQETRTVTCGVQGVNEREVERLRDLYLSAHVDLWLGGNEWQEVFVVDGGLVTSTGMASKLHNVSLTFKTEGRAGQW